MDAPLLERPPRGRLSALFLGLCPGCRRGRIFRGLFSMNESCPVCGLKFDREPGYFLGAMYFAYTFGVLVLGSATALLWYLVIPDWEIHWVVLLLLGPFLLVVPVMFRWSRVLWIHFDRYWDPGGPENP